MQHECQPRALLPAVCPTRTATYSSLHQIPYAGDIAYLRNVSTTAGFDGDRLVRMNMHVHCAQIVVLCFLDLRFAIRGLHEKGWALIRVKVYLAGFAFGTAPG